ncbi:Unknown protein sequence [Pseudomonas amygdali pv. myricae]|nr:Unknown protein sequence [Pseudomonas amygdali pv. myricae]
MPAGRRGIDYELEQRADSLLVVRLPDPVAKTVNTVCRFGESRRKGGQRNVDRLRKGANGHWRSDLICEHFHESVVSRYFTHCPIDEKGIGFAIVSDQLCPLCESNVQRRTEQNVLVQRPVRRVHDVGHLRHCEVCLEVHTALTARQPVRDARRLALFRCQCCFRTDHNQHSFATDCRPLPSQEPCGGLMGEKLSR